MTKKILMSTMLLLAICFSFVSCSDDKNDATTTSSAVINLEMPMTIQDGTLHNVKIIFTNKSTAQTYTIEKVEKTANGYTATIENLPIGSYSVVAVGTANFSVDGQQTTTEVKATNENVTLLRINQVTLSSFYSTYSQVKRVLLYLKYSSAAPQEMEVVCITETNTLRLPTTAIRLYMPIASLLWSQLQKRQSTNLLKGLA